MNVKIAVRKMLHFPKDALWVLLEGLSSLKMDNILFMLCFYHGSSSALNYFSYMPYFFFYVITFLKSGSFWLSPTSPTLSLVTST